jgi:hypothetical protein
MDNKNELKQLIKEQKDIVKQILQLQEKENNIIIKIRRLKQKVKNVGTPWRKDFKDGQ